ncbi:arginine/serine-rich coiled-coil protein 2 [Dorcoceras hygrometricum]|uniref:Arginine/serine-rich coiled-coil protein 2 n=1 Tax=Dorcoceras hygrometricum TaxID=472368 RepID=A0A2Z7BJY2_9LAMI|nr:arginine/serine-rich coiled-coil protein 2 [Dorcoceras hygrometricum]
MDSKAIENVDSKAEFRKPLNDSGNRKYRRRSSPGGSSSSSDGSQHEHSSSPLPSRKGTSKFAEDKRKRDDGRGLDRDYGRSQSSRNSDLNKHTDQQSSRGYHRHDDHHRRDRRVDDYDRGHSKSSYSSRRERDHHGSRDYPNDVDIHSQKKSDGSGHRSRDKDSSDRAGSGRRYANSENRFKDKDKQGDGRDYEVGKSDRRRSSGDHKNNHSSIYDEPECQRNDSSSRRENSGHHWKEAPQRDVKGLDRDTTIEERRGHDNRDSSKEQFHGKPVEHTISVGIKTFSSDDQDSLSKKPKLFSDDVSLSGADGTSEQSYVTDSDIDAAKIAAMRAAELVNKNLVGTGYMSADQKKKLLWGSKKNTKIEEGVKGDTVVGNQPDNPDVEKQQEQLQLELERQYTAGLRRRDGRTVGLGL